MFSLELIVWKTWENVFHELNEKLPERLSMTKKQKKTEETIETGMEVEATRGDLGEDDVSKPKVTEVVQDQQGKVDKLIVKKGKIFKKTLEIPADRIASINQEDNVDESVPGKVIVDVSKKEAEALTPVGAEALVPEEEHNLLDKVEQEVPTAEGLREIEASKSSTQAKQTSVQSGDDESQTKKTISSCTFSVQGS